jgi:2-phosphoglycolate phosphatase
MSNELIRPQAVLFDLDGTLVDTAPDFYDVVNTLRADEGKTPLPHERIREQVSNGGIALACITFEIEREHPEIQTFRQRVLDRYETEIGKQAQLFTGFSEVLDALEQLNIPWGIVTNKPAKYTQLLLDRMTLNAACVICPEDVNVSKPAPDGLLLAAQQLNVDPNQCWYIGDHRRDIEAAHNANMLSIAATFGYIEPTDDPINWNAHQMINHASELMPLLNTRLSR